MTSNPLIFSVCTKETKTLALNWINHLQKIKISNYKIFCFDIEAYDFLHSERANVEYVRDSDSNKKIWLKRLRCALSLIKRGEDIIMSDLDAIWLKNPIKFIKEEYDIVASTGIFPKSSLKKMGFTICMGWIYFKSKPAVISLLEQTASKMVTEENFDDQKSINEILFLENEEYADQNLEELKIFSQENLSSEKFQLNMQILGQRIIPRYKNTISKNHYVIHPYDPNQENEATLKELNLWTLN